MENLSYAPILGAEHARSLISTACRENPYFFDRQVRHDVWVTFVPTGPDELEARASGPDGEIIASAIVNGDDCE